MSTNNRIAVAPLNSLPVNQGVLVRLADRELALFNLGSRCLVIDNECPHQGGPLSDGIVSSVDGQVTVTCPMHSRRVCLESGRIVKPATFGPCVRTYPAAIENGVVYLSLEPAPAPECAAPECEVA